MAWGQAGKPVRRRPALLLARPKRFLCNARARLDLPSHTPRRLSQRKGARTGSAMLTGGLVCHPCPKVRPSPCEHLGRPSDTMPTGQEALAPGLAGQSLGTSPAETPRPPASQGWALRSRRQPLATDACAAVASAMGSQLCDSIPTPPLAQQT